MTVNQVKKWIQIKNNPTKNTDNWSTSLLQPSTTSDDSWPEVWVEA